METLHDGDRVGEPTVVTIGAFDGVHRGHQALIAEARRRAATFGARTAVVTFDRHPASVVRPDSAPRLLTNLTQKLELLAAAGADIAYVVHFDEERSLEAPEDFVREVLVDALHARAVVVGEDFHFGHRRRGDVALLRSIGAEHGFTVDGIGLVDVPGVEGPVSSTAVRAALAGGEVARAAVLLGRPFEVRGVVEHGDKRGRELGFPTANVAVPGDMCVPADGVYSGWFRRRDGETHRAAISVGRRPTFHREPDAPRLVEAYVIDFDGDLYGESVAVAFDRFLRGQQRFDAVDDLLAQMARDVDAART